MPEFEDIKYVGQGGLNYDDGLEAYPPSDYRYALNCIQDELGEYGTITNIKGNQLVTVTWGYNGVNTVIGSCEDKEIRALIWFVYNSRGHHSIVRYKIEQNLVEFILHNRTILNFDLNHRINNAGIIGSGWRKMLFWTDDYNPPRKLNIAMAKGFTVCSSTSTTSTYTTTTSSTSTSSTSTTSTSSTSTTSTSTSSTTTNWGLLSAEYTDVYNAMPTKPSYVDALRQDEMLSALVNLGVYTKAELLDVFATHTGGSLINWANPGTFNPSLSGAPVFTQYAGYTGNSVTEACVRLNFKPATNGTLISQNNICAIIGVGNDILSGEVDFGASEPGGVNFFIQSKGGANVVNFTCNTTSQNTYANASGKKYYAMSRNNANFFNSYVNFDLTVINDVSDAFINRELVACGRSISINFFASDRQLRFVFLFSFLTSNEIREVMEIMEHYLDHYGTGLSLAPMVHSTSSTSTSTSSTTTTGYDYRRKS